MSTVQTNDAEATTAAIPDRAELVARAASLKPLLREHAAQMDTERRLVAEVNTALVDAGMFRLLTPARFGGYEAGLRTTVEVVATLGEADGSAAWLVSIGTAATWLLGMVSREAQDTVFGADPGARLAGSASTPGVARRVDGGFLMSGRWSNASGAQDATWASIAAAVLDDEGTVVDAVMATVPASDLTVEDTWHVIGMRGTGSNTFVGSDVFVPDEMTIPLAGLSDGTLCPTTADAVYRLPISGLAGLTLVAPIVGMGYAALALAIEKAADKPLSQTTYTRQADSVGVQIHIAEAAMKLKTARLHLYDAAAELDSAAAEGNGVGYAARALTRATAGHVAQQVLEAIQMLVSVHGAGSFAEANPMQRIWRDANTAARHGGLNTLVGYEVYGKALLGIAERIGRMV
jgi:3-hydroxy-9,10-secoandrosta-1,3,5(10)-triene-9,17-dione monooxygenase